MVAVAIHLDGVDSIAELEQAAKIIKNLDNTPETLQRGITRVKWLLRKFGENRNNFLDAKERVLSYVENREIDGCEATSVMLQIIQADSGRCGERESLFIEQLGCDKDYSINPCPIKNITL